MFIEIPGIVEQLRQNDNNLRLGYFVGSGADAGRTGFIGSTGSRLSRNGVWFTKGDNFGSVSAHFIASGGTETGTARMSLSETLYAGKPVFEGGNFCLFYCPSEEHYIYMRGNDPHEPLYIVDSLTGETSGEFFWRTVVSEIPYRASNYDSAIGQNAIRGTLAGAADEWTSSYPRTISGNAYLPRYAYEDNDDDEFPAGKYYWVEDSSDYFRFGRLHYKDQNHNVWDLVDDNPYTLRGPSVRIKYYEDESTEPMGAGFYDQTSVENGTFHFANAQPEDRSIHVLGYSACSGQYTRMQDGDYTLTMSGHTIKDCTSSTQILMGEVSLWR